MVATQTVNSPDLVARLKERAAEQPHRYTFICPRSGDDHAARRSATRLAATLAELYRAEIDATGQPMSPEPFAAVQNAIEHYRIDEILISTLAGEQSKWLEEGLIERSRRSPTSRSSTSRRAAAAAQRAASSDSTEVAAGWRAA